MSLKLYSLVILVRFHLPDVRDFVLSHLPLIHSELTESGQDDAWFKFVHYMFSLSKPKRDMSMYHKIGFYINTPLFYNVHHQNQLNATIGYKE